MARQPQGPRGGVPPGMGPAGRPMAPRGPQQQPMPRGAPPMMGLPGNAVPARGMIPPQAKAPAAPMGGAAPPMTALVAQVPTAPGGPSFAYTKQARNKEAIPGVPTVGGTVPIQQPGQPEGTEPLNSQVLASMSAEQQKNALGERLFARISETHPEYAAKITGMLLEMDTSETLNLLETPDILRGKIEEALDVLKAHVDSSGFDTSAAPTGGI